MFSVIVGGISLGQAAPNLTAFAKGRAAAFNIFDLIARKSAIDPDDERGACLEHVSGRIELRNVRFYYPARPDVPVFQVSEGNFREPSSLPSPCRATSLFSHPYTHFGFYVIFGRFLFFRRFVF